MNTRISRRIGILAPATVMCGLLLSALPALAQTRGGGDNLSVQLDERKTADLVSRSSDGRVPVAELLLYAGSVSLAGERAMTLALHVKVVRDGKIVAEYQSSPFKIRPGSHSLGQFVSGDHYGTVAFNAENVRSQRSALDAGSAVDEAAEHVITGPWPGKPDGWRDMDAVYVVAAPVDASLASTRPIVVFASAFAMPEHMQD